MSENKQVSDWMSEFAAGRRFIAWKPASQHIVTGDPDESQCSSVLVTLGQLEHFKLNILFVFFIKQPSMLQASIILQGMY